MDPQEIRETLLHAILGSLLTRDGSAARITTFSLHLTQMILKTQVHLHSKPLTVSLNVSRIVLSVRVNFLTGLSCVFFRLLLTGHCPLFFFQIMLMVLWFVNKAKTITLVLWISANSGFFVFVKETHVFSRSSIATYKTTSYKIVVWFQRHSYVPILLPLNEIK